MKSHAQETTDFNPRVLNEIGRQFEFAERTKDDVALQLYDILCGMGIVKAVSVCG